MTTTGTRASERGWLRRLAGYCWRYRRTVLIALGGALAATVATAAIPLVQRQVIDNVIVDGSSGLVARIAANVRWIQSGYLYHYAFSMILGLVVLLGGLWWVARA